MSSLTITNLFVCNGMYFCCVAYLLCCFFDVLLVCCVAFLLCCFCCGFVKSIILHSQRFWLHFKHSVVSKFQKQKIQQQKIIPIKSKKNTKIPKISKTNCFRAVCMCFYVLKLFTSISIYRQDQERLKTKQRCSKTFLWRSQISI